MRLASAFVKIYLMTMQLALLENNRMTIDSMTEIVENIQSIYTIILALAIAEAFNQAVKETKPAEETKPAPASEEAKPAETSATAPA